MCIGWVSWSPIWTHPSKLLTQGTYLLGILASTTASLSNTPLSIDHVCLTCMPSHNNNVIRGSTVPLDFCCQKAPTNIQ